MNCRWHKGHQIRTGVGFTTIACFHLRLRHQIPSIQRPHIAADSLALIIGEWGNRILHRRNGLRKASMRTWKKIVLLVVLAFLEVVFLSWVFASNLPRRSSDIDAFMRYQNSPTEENKELWLKERQITENEVTRRRGVGAALALGNLFLIGWLVRKRQGPSVSGASASQVSP